MSTGGVYRTIIASHVFHFEDLTPHRLRAGPVRSDDPLAGVAAASAQECNAAQQMLAELPLRQFLNWTGGDCALRSK